MTTVLRRMFWLALLGGGGFAAWSWWQRNHAPPRVAAPVWPPLDSPTTDRVSTVAQVDDPPTPNTEGSAVVNATAHGYASADGTSWLLPVDGQCPVGYPVKANDNSGIYHVPGGRFYDRTVPERCYARTEDAEADGYRAAKA